MAVDPNAVSPARVEDETRVLLLAPTVRDADACQRFLAAEGVASHRCGSLANLVAEVPRGAGMILVAEQSLSGDRSGSLANALAGQPVWSDLPVVVLSAGGAESATVTRAFASLGNVSVVERPVRVSTFLSVVRSGLRARERQYQVRDQFAAQARDREALRQSEERLRALVEASSDALYRISPDWGEMRTLRGGSYIEGADEPRRDWLRAHVDPADLPRVRAAIGEAIRTKGVFELEHRFRRPDGTTGWTFSRAIPVFDAAGEIIEWFGASNDLTARKEAEAVRERLLESERAGRARAEALAAEAERAGRMKDEFLATLSHELRTPLNAMLGWSQVVLRNPGNADTVAEGLTTIQRNARAQAQIIEDLLDMSRIISGKVRLDVQQVDLSAIVRAAVETARPTADAKGVRLASVVDPLHGLSVGGDPSRLQQVLWNLIANAIKFTPKGGQVRVLLERVNSHIEVSVTDTGEGINPDFLPHVFDRFRQQDASTTRKHGGLGLGLSIVKQLVELHGGSVRVKSTGVGQGSTFTVALPVAVLRHAAGPEDVEPRRHPHAGGTPVPIPDLRGRLAGVRVLVVDDEPDARGLVKRVLEDCEAIVTTAASAEEAIDRLPVDRPDVLVSDIGMPGEDGYSLIRKVRALPAGRGGTVPALAVTAYARAEDRVRAVLTGFQMHVAKPVEPAELVAMVASLAARANARAPT